MTSISENLIKELAPFAKAKAPVDPNLLKIIPYFETIFPDQKLWPYLVRLSGDDGRAYIEYKRYKSGQKLIAKGKFDQMIYWVVEGSAQVVAKIKVQSKVIHEAQKGECLGELGVLKGIIRTADVVAGKNGVDVLEFDWAITEKSPNLGKYLFHLIALHLADKLENAYSKQLKIIANSILVLHEKTSQLIERNRALEQSMMEHSIMIGKEFHVDQEQALSHAIASIKESLSFLKLQESQDNLDKLGVV
nr:cyclic nucleotide-binding domain-containing protein [Desulfobulbaceae bacterium]